MSSSFSKEIQEKPKTKNSPRQKKKVLTPKESKRSFKHLSDSHDGRDSAEAKHRNQKSYQREKYSSVDRNVDSRSSLKVKE